MYEQHAAHLLEVGISVSFKVEPRLPLLDLKKGLHCDKQAPDGHGYAGRLILDEIRQRPNEGEGRVRCIYNGDGLNNEPSPEMVGFIREKKAAFGIVSTQRTAADFKGGIFGLKQLPDGSWVPALMERAQADKDKVQQEIFDNVGITNETRIAVKEHIPGGQYFNTNTVHMNEDLLHDFLNKVYAQLGKELYNQVVAPEWMQKTKTVDGNEYFTAEGALGSLLLRLNEQVQSNQRLRQIWDEVSGGSEFVQIINLELENRNDFFTPIKQSIDFFLFEYSDLYYLETNYYSEHFAKLRSHVPHHIWFEGDIREPGYYANVLNVTNSFGFARMRNLHYLKAEGAFICPNVEWGGNVIIKVPGTEDNPTVLDRNKLRDLLQDAGIRQYEGHDVLIIRDVSIIVHSDGSYELKRLN